MPNRLGLARRTIVIGTSRKLSAQAEIPNDFLAEDRAFKRGAQGVGLSRAVGTVDGEGSPKVRFQSGPEVEMSKCAPADSTVECHASVVLMRRNVTDRTKAVVTALQRGLVHL